MTTEQIRFIRKARGKIQNSGQDEKKSVYDRAIALGNSAKDARRIVREVFN